MAEHHSDCYTSLTASASLIKLMAMSIRRCIMFVITALLQFGKQYMSTFHATAAPETVFQST